MKKGLLIILFLGIIPQGFSQTLTPEFEFQLYFEDAVGNKDTVTLGYDALATAGIDADFGEVNILNEPWGENLDVRIGNKIFSGASPDGLGGQWCIQSDIDPYFDYSISDNTHLSKCQITRLVCSEENVDESEAGGRSSIQFFTPNYPIIMKWNKNHFSSLCVWNSIFFGLSDHYNWDAGGAIYLNGVDSVILTDPSHNSEANPFPFSYDNNGKQIGILQFELGPDYTVSLPDYSSKKIEIYPNPVTMNDFITVSVKGAFQFYNLTGEMIQSGKIEDGNIPVNINNSGLYLLKIKSSNGSIYTFKITVL